eukprot:762681-Hanusia_phi.AAC.1
MLRNIRKEPTVLRRSPPKSFHQSQSTVLPSSCRSSRSRSVWTREVQQEERETVEDEETYPASPVVQQGPQDTALAPGAGQVQVTTEQQIRACAGKVEQAVQSLNVEPDPPSSSVPDIVIAVDEDAAKMKGAGKDGGVLTGKGEEEKVKEAAARVEQSHAKIAPLTSQADSSRGLSDGVARMLQAASVWQKRCIDAEEATQRVYPILSKACSQLQQKQEEEKECRKILSSMKTEVSRLRVRHHDCQQKLSSSQQECRSLVQEVQSLTARLAEREESGGGSGTGGRMDQQDSVSLRAAEMQEELNMSRELIGELKRQVGELRSRNVELENILERYVHLWSPQVAQEEGRRRRIGREEDEREVDLGDLGSLLSSGLVTKARNNWMATWRGEAEKQKEALEHREKEMNALIAVLEETTMQVAVLEEEKEKEKELRTKAERERASSEMRVQEAEQHSKTLAREKSEMQEELKRLQAAVRACQARMYQHSLSLAHQVLPRDAGGAKEHKAQLQHPQSLADPLPPLPHRSLVVDKEQQAVGNSGSCEEDPSSSSSSSSSPPTAAYQSQQVARQEEELLKLRAKVLEQRTWSLKAWQEIQRLNGVKLNLEQELEFFKERMVEEERTKESVATSELLRECLWLAVKEGKALLLSDFVDLPREDKEEYLNRITAILQAASLSSGKEDSLPPNLASASVNDTCIGLMQLLKKEKLKLREAKKQIRELEEQVGHLHEETRRLQEVADMRGYVAVQ